jgi:tRNA threonylcarbamoyl adenosine modification protein (Sua5/YciO/YrdC/YwlC family)
MRLAVYAEHPEPRKIQRAVEVLEKGGVVAYPTDTVYGLGCDLTNKAAVDRIYRMKRMRDDQLLAFLCPDLSEIARYAVVENATYRTLKRAVPGPFCFILPATREVPRMLMSKRKTIGIRVPDHPVAQALVRGLGRPIVSSSASLNGEQLQDPDDIARAFPDVDLILDVGICGIIPSTVVDMTGDEPVLQRQGLGDVSTLS